ncbi:hypothetical protein [Streptomyces globosus]|uniref:hypothetical protein n=1 Tax=Streptomyces globosus TaxID=68209 RepID=UPI0031E43004
MLTGLLVDVGRPMPPAAFTDPNHLMRRLRHGLRQIQYRSDIIDGCLTATGVILTSNSDGPRCEPPQHALL